VETQEDHIFDTLLSLMGQLQYMFGYIGVSWPKEHSPEVQQIRLEIPFIYEKPALAIKSSSSRYKETHVHALILDLLWDGGP